MVWIALILKRIFEGLVKKKGLGLLGGGNKKAAIVNYADIA